MCDAVRLIEMATHEINMQRGNGAWNLAAIQRILTQPRETCTEKDHHV